MPTAEPASSSGGTASPAAAPQMCRGARGRRLHGAFLSSCPKEMVSPSPHPSTQPKQGAPFWKAGTGEAASPRGSSSDIAVTRDELVLGWWRLEPRENILGRPRHPRQGAAAQCQVGRVEKAPALPLQKGDGLVERIPSGEIPELSLGLEGTLRDD